MNMVKNSKKFILSASCTNEYLDGFDTFVLGISPEYARLLLERIKLLESVRAKDGEAYELYFWDYSGDYFGCELEEQHGDLEPSRTECNQLVVREDEVLWTAIAKHTDVYVTTDSIKAADLAEVAGSPR